MSEREAIMILFIDDEPRRVKLYVEELKLFGYQVKFKDNIEDALTFWEEHKQEIKLIVLDVMISIKNNWDEEVNQETEYGLKAGIYFYNKFLKNQDIPVILFTHYSDNNLLDHDDNKVIILKKIDYLPFEFVKKIQTILKPTSVSLTNRKYSEEIKMILFIDDEYRRVTPYIEELKSSGYTVEFKDNVDDALNFRKERKQDLELIVLDIMMPIGDNFDGSAQQESEYGLKTGIYFYNKYLKSQGIPVILFTHLSDANIPDNEDDQVYLFKKLDLLPYEFVQKAKAILKKNL